MQVFCHNFRSNDFCICSLCDVAPPQLSLSRLPDRNLGVSFGRVAERLKSHSHFLPILLQVELRLGLHSVGGHAQVVLALKASPSERAACDAEAVFAGAPGLLCEFSKCLAVCFLFPVGAVKRRVGTPVLLLPKAPQLNPAD